MRFETSTLAALAAIASVTANIVEHDDGVANPSDATNHGNHGNRELTPAESPRAWAKITKTDVVKQENGTSLIPTKIGNSELLSKELTSVWSKSPLHPSETMLENVPLTPPPHDDNAKSQDMDPIHFSDLGILAKNHVQKEVEPMSEFLLESEFQMIERDLEEVSCETKCSYFTALPVFGNAQELYDAIRVYCPTKNNTGSSYADPIMYDTGMGYMASDSTGMDYMASDSTGMGYTASDSTGMYSMASASTGLDKMASDSTGMDKMASGYTGMNYMASGYTGMSNNYTCTFDAFKPINCWNVVEVDDMSKMFYGLEQFNEPLKCWNVMKVTNMERMFYTAHAFDQPVYEWNVSQVSNMHEMFAGASAFNQPVDMWNVSQVSNMGGMFSSVYNFNQAVDTWNVSQVSNMYKMFAFALSFNQPVEKWNVSQVSNMSGMFAAAVSFDQPVNEWDVSQVSSMRGIFYTASAFNQPVDGWNVSQVSNMNGMFFMAYAFNQPINEWDVSQVTDMYQMFFRATTFNQCLGTWPATVPTSVLTTSMFYYTACPQPAFVNTWCQNEDNQCTATIAKSFSTHWIERAKNDDNQHAKVNNDNPVTIETFFKVKNDENISLEIFYNVPEHTSCIKGIPLTSGNDPTRTKIKDNTEDSTATYKARYVIDVKTLLGTPAYVSSTGTIKICTTVAKMLESEYISIVETSFELTVNMEGTVSSDFVQAVTIEYDSEGGQESGTITNSVSIDTFLCAPSRNADTKFKMGDEFGVCVRPDANAISDGYAVTKFESVVCSNGDTSTSRTLISASVIQDKLTKMLDDMSNTFDKEGKPAGKEAAGFVSLVTAGFFVDKTKDSFECTGKVSLKKARRKKRQRLLQEESTTSPFSTTIVLDTKNVPILSADASMVSWVGAVLLSTLVAIM